MFPAVLAFGGALIYGAADFLGGLAAKRLRSIVVTAVAAATGLVLLALAYPLIGGEWLAADVAWGVLSGLTGAIAIMLLYACLAIGPMTVLSPLTAVVSAVAPILWGLAVEGETLSWIGYAGLGIALVAVVLVAFVPGEKVVRPSARGLVYAVGAGLAIGAFLIIIDQTSDESGLVPLIVNRSVSTLITSVVVGILAIVAVRGGRRAASVLVATSTHLGATPTGHADLEHAETGAPTLAVGAASGASSWWLAAACGVLDALANIALLLALRIGDLAIVSALTAMYPAGTVLLAAVVLRERIAAVQWIGLALALLAGGMLALA